MAKAQKQGAGAKKPAAKKPAAKKASTTNVLSVKDLLDQDAPIIIKGGSLILDLKNKFEDEWHYVGPKGARHIYSNRNSELQILNVTIIGTTANEATAFLTSDGDCEVRVKYE